nr:uncharacterized protein LOC123750362 [Procambarus clarkii]
MPKLLDAFPGLSQIKSVVQLVTGDTEGAAATQQNFLKLCPGVSQVTSVVQVISGDEEGAKETQKEFLKGVNDLVDSVPVVGHAKGTAHFAFGDNAGGHKAVQAANRTTGAIIGGVGGLVVGAPVGAVKGAIAGGNFTSTLSSPPEDYPDEEFQEDSNSSRKLNKK